MTNQVNPSAIFRSAELKDMLTRSKTQHRCDERTARRARHYRDENLTDHIARYYSVQCSYVPVYAVRKKFTRDSLCLDDKYFGGYIYTL
jgi:hypothetical protein